MFRWFSALVPTAILAMAALWPAGSAAQTMQGYDAPKDTPAKTATSAAPATPGYGGGLGYDPFPWGSAEMLEGYPHVGFLAAWRGGYWGLKYYCCFRRSYGYPYYGPSLPIASQSFPLACGRPVIGTVYSGCRGCAGACASAPALPLASGPANGASPGGTASSGAPANGPTVPPPAKQTPPSNNAAHLQLIVPENAEVVIEDRKTTRTGSVRQFVSPPLTPGKNFTYQVAIRYRDNNGAMIEEKHAIRVRANDQLRMDFTRTASRPSDRPASETLPVFAEH